MVVLVIVTKPPDTVKFPVIWASLLTTKIGVFTWDPVTVDVAMILPVDEMVAA